MIDRYTRPMMAALWTKENKFQTWLAVELAATDAWAELGIVPKEDAAAMRRNARFSVERIEEIEETTRHDVVAFTRCVAENLGPESKYLHYGLTSTDVVDTSLSSILRKACDILIEDTDALIQTLRAQAVRWKRTPIMGRTHGVHAEPTTLGLKFALWYAETLRNKARLERARDTISVGKISGAVGTYANVDPFVEQYVCRAMGLTPSPISTQTLQRDRHAEFVSTLAIVASCLDKYATEIRGLQKTEIREVEEPFRAGQKGSSAMPHKRNPINCEQVSGLARLIRGYTVTALEDIPLWHERDISHSSAERVILADAAQLLDYMLAKMNGILRDLIVYPENMLRNMERSLGLPFSQHVLLSLIQKGMLREDAYDLIQRRAMQAWSEQKQFRSLIVQEWEVRSRMTDAELDACFDPAYHTQHIDEIYTRLGLNEV
ncbi:MAG: adenylosuccinate lyase [Oscillospiraceae bacterium]|jgi:adenylosuccinate lyase|nr:adenylosuccinate lyase [Oscillospiraceae bacterium]